MEPLTLRETGQSVAALLPRARAGDRDAFDGLYALTVARVYGLCLRMSGSTGEAERLTQDTYVRAWTKLDSFRGDAEFGTWLHRVAVNVVLQDRRSAQRRLERVEYADALDAPARAAEPGLRLDLERAIAALPPGARAALVLHDVEGYKHEEIARMTGSAVGTIKAQLHRARRLVRRALERGEERQ